MPSTIGNYPSCCLSNIVGITADMATAPPSSLLTSKSRKLDTVKARALREKGLPITDIAAATGVTPSTVWRFLQSTDQETQQLKQYVSGRVEAFQKLQAKGLDLQHRIIDSFSDGILAAMKPHEKTNLLQSVNTVIGTIYDKERLESGKSTQNIGIVAKMMGDALDNAFTDPKDNNELEKK